MQFGVSEVARALGRARNPAHAAGRRDLWPGRRGETREFAALSLQPFCARFADELGGKLLTPAQRAGGYAVEFDLTRLLVRPGEIAERMRKLVNGGVMTVNESRNQLGLPDVPAAISYESPFNTRTMSAWLTAERKAQPPANDATPNDVGRRIRQRGTRAAIEGSSMTPEEIVRQ